MALGTILGQWAVLQQSLCLELGGIGDSDCLGMELLAIAPVMVPTSADQVPLKLLIRQLIESPMVA